MQHDNGYANQTDDFLGFLDSAMGKFEASYRRDWQRSTGPKMLDGSLLLGDMDSGFPASLILEMML